MFRGFLLAGTMLWLEPAAAQDFGTDMPAEPVPGVTFPTPETTINGWVFANPQDTAAIYLHGWGIWAGLTADSGTSAFGIDNARIYQTWLSPKQVLDLMNGQSDEPDLVLRPPNQLQSHGDPGPALTNDTPANAAGIKVDTSIAEVVAYSPPSARFVFDNKLLWTETLQEYIARGYTEIPDFPAAAVNVKPVYKLISPAELNDVNGQMLYAMPAWPGTPDFSGWTREQLAAGYDSPLWDQCVYVDVSNTGSSTANGVDPGCDSPDASSTYALGNFISIPITEADLAYFQSETGGQLTELAVGDTLILVGMHVTSRETRRWSWQTFWWSADPDAPNAPSSTAIAGARPAALTGPARHYAMASAYSMLVPAQPLVGGENAGDLLPAYNPHLEAGFGTGTFKVVAPVAVTGAAEPQVTWLGVQSNCMSCHGLAAYQAPRTGYASNLYVPLDSPVFDGGLRADFAWSIVVESEPKPAQ